MCGPISFVILPGDPVDHLLSQAKVLDTRGYTVLVHVGGVTKRFNDSKLFENITSGLQKKENFRVTKTLLNSALVIIGSSHPTVTEFIKIFNEHVPPVRTLVYVEKQLSRTPSSEARQKIIRMAPNLLLGSNNLIDLLILDQTTPVSAYKRRANWIGYNPIEVDSSMHEWASGFAANREEYQLKLKKHFMVKYAIEGRHQILAYMGSKDPDFF